MNKKRFFCFFLILIITLISFIGGISYALPDASYEFYVYDEANIIDSEIERYIVSTNKSLYEKTGAQVVVATIDSLEGLDINSYATSLFDKWDIGSKKDNGMLMLIVPEEGEMWIETGYGVEGAFPDSKIKRIIEDHMIPYFKADRYSDGVLAGFNEIILGLKEEYNLNLEMTEQIENPITSAEDSDSFSISEILIFIGIIIFFIIDFVFFRGMITYSLLRGIGRGGGGGGGSGGLSSGGGGRSGGGGAGGSW